MNRLLRNIQIRRAQSAEWNAKNPVLLAGEPGFATDCRQLKFGDGLSHWNELTGFHISWIDPRDFGAKGDGATDDYAAFVAMSAAFPNGGAFLISPNCIFLLSGEWTPPNNSLIEGGGWSSILKKSPNQSQNNSIISVPNGSNIIIINLAFDGNKLNQPVGDWNRMGIYAPSAENLTIGSCYFTNMSHAGIYTRNNSKNVQISGNTFYNCGQDSGSLFPAVYLTAIDGITNGVRIIGNHFENNRSAIGLRSGGGTQGNDVALFDLVVSGNTFKDNARNLTFSNISNCTIQGNSFYNMAAIRTPETSCIDSEGYSDDVNIHGNNLKLSSDQAGISIANAITEVSVVGNVIQGTTVGILVASPGSDYISVYGNSIKNCSTVGILVDGVLGHVAVVGNVLRDTVQNKTNIQVQNSADTVIVLGNIISGTGGAGAAVAISSATRIIDEYNVGDGYQLNENIVLFSDGDTSPSVSVGSKFMTGNTNPTTINTFDDAVRLKRFLVFINDSHTTIDVNSGLIRGNLGANFSPTSGDWLDCFNNGTCSYCKWVRGNG